MDFIQNMVIEFASSYWVLLIIFACAFIDGFFPPIPAESLLITLGSLAATTGQVHIVAVCIVGAVAAWLGDIVAYHIGRHIPLYRIPFLNKGAGKKALETAQRSIQSRGSFYILVARFVPVGRIAVNMTAGAMGFPRSRFIPTAGFAGVVWSVYAVVLGFGAGSVLRNNHFLAVVFGIGLGVVSGFLLDRLIVWFGNFLAVRVSSSSNRFLRWLSVEDIENQGIDVSVADRGVVSRREGYFDEGLVSSEGVLGQESVDGELDGNVDGVEPSVDVDVSVDLGK